MQIEYIDAGTPITNTHYIGAPKGEIYGVDHGIARFSPEFNATIRPQTPLKNLYLTGASSSASLHKPQLHFYTFIPPNASFVSQVRTCFCAVSPAPSQELSPAARSFSTATSIWTPSPWPKDPKTLTSRKRSSC